VSQTIAPPNGLLDALGVSSVVEVQRSVRLQKTLVRLKDEAAVRNLSPNGAKMRALPKMSGVIVTATAERPYDFVSRYFNPWAGIDEDPVTGSAHTVLAPYWSKRLGKKAFHALQASPRGGRLRVSLVDGDRVHIEGTCTFDAPKTFPDG
jgi:PhzF family phenazine biosynthesis protein